MQNEQVSGFKYPSTIEKRMEPNKKIHVFLSLGEYTVCKVKKSYSKDLCLTAKTPHL